MKSFAPICTCILGLLFFQFAKCESKNDSLLYKLSIAKTDIEKVDLLNQLAQNYIDNNPDSAAGLAKQALELAVKIKYNNGEGRVRGTIGYYTMNIGYPDEALVDFNKALKIFEITKNKIEKAKILSYTGMAYFYKSENKTALIKFQSALKIYEEIQDLTGVSDQYNNIGIIYQALGDNASALNSYYKALRINKSLKNATSLANSYVNIGIVLENQGNYSEALKNYFEALKLDEPAGNKFSTAIDYHNIGNVYFKKGDLDEALKNYTVSLGIREEINDNGGICGANICIGNILLEQKKYSEAFKYYYVALSIAKKIDDQRRIRDIYNNIGETYYLQGNYTEALTNYFICRDINKQIDDLDGMAFVNINIGNDYVKKGSITEGKRWINEALSIAKQLGNVNYLKFSYLALAGADSAQGDFKSAYKNYKQYILFRDSLINEESNKKIVQQQMQYDFDKKESLAKAEQEKKDALALKELQKEKLVRNGFIGGFAVVFLFAVVFFTQRNKIKKGKKRSDELLLNILPSEVAEELKEKGTAEAKQFDNVTVMFTDFKNFTRISEKLTASELVAEINFCFKAFDNIMDKHRIEKIKTIGDSYMAAGGLPVPNKTNAADVINAAIEIQYFMNEQNQIRSWEKKEIFELRIGIHTGPVVAGIVGVKKFAYDIWGDTVNIASRMESSSEAGKINISENTYGLVKDIFNCDYRGEIEAKGKGKIKMYFINA